MPAHREQVSTWRLGQRVRFPRFTMGLRPGSRVRLPRVLLLFSFFARLSNRRMKLPKRGGRPTLLLRCTSRALHLARGRLIPLPLPSDVSMRMAILLPTLCLTLLSPRTGLRKNEPLDPFWTTTPSGLVYHTSGRLAVGLRPGSEIRSPFTKRSASPMVALYSPPARLVTRSPLPSGLIK